MEDPTVASSMSLVSSCGESVAQVALNNMFLAPRTQVAPTATCGLPTCSAITMVTSVSHDCAPAASSTPVFGLSSDSIMPNLAPMRNPLDGGLEGSAVMGDSLSASLSSGSIPGINGESLGMHVVLELEVGDDATVGGGNYLYSDVGVTRISVPSSNGVDGSTEVVLRHHAAPASSSSASATARASCVADAAACIDVSVQDDDGVLGMSYVGANMELQQEEVGMLGPEDGSGNAAVLMEGEYLADDEGVVPAEPEPEQTMNELSGEDRSFGDEDEDEDDNDEDDEDDESEGDEDDPADGFAAAFEEGYIATNTEVSASMGPPDAAGRDSDQELGAEEVVGLTDGSKRRSRQKFNCGMCHKTFSRRRHLNVHEDSHTDTRRYACKVCGSAFRDPAHLHHHRAVHSDNRPHQCKICGKAFKHGGQLHRHTNVHVSSHRFVCDDCGRAYTTKHNLDQHRLVHSGKTSTCGICGRPFVRQLHLENHIRTHTGERPHICKLCGASFTQASGLARHVRTLHKDGLVHSTPRRRRTTGERKASKPGGGGIAVAAEAVQSTIRASSAGLAAAAGAMESSHSATASAVNAATAAKKQRRYRTTEK